MAIAPPSEFPQIPIGKFGFLFFISSTIFEMSNFSLYPKVQNSPSLFPCALPSKTIVSIPSLARSLDSPKKCSLHPPIPCTKMIIPLAESCSLLIQYPLRLKFSLVFTLS